MTEKKHLPGLCVFAGTDDPEALKLLAEGDLAKLCLLCRKKFPDHKVQTCVAPDAPYFHCTYCNLEFVFEADSCPQCGNSQCLEEVFNTGC